MQILKDIEKNIVGQPCFSAKIGYADVLKLSFGKKKHYQNSKYKNQIYGEIELSIETFSWRLMNKTTVVCGSADDYKNAENGLKHIIGKTIKKIISKNNNFQLIFDDNYIFEAFKIISKNEDLLFIDIENDTIKNYVFDGLNWTDYENLGLSDSEIKLSNFSETTTKRWISEVPQIGKTKFCKNCAYFLGISGRFYFGDYGVCANQKSEFDGKIVNKKSTCKNYSVEL